jgi:hypothetical protein
MKPQSDFESGNQTAPTSHEGDNNGFSVSNLNCGVLPWRRLQFNAGGWRRAPVHIPGVGCQGREGIGRQMSLIHKGESKTIRTELGGGWSAWLGLRQSGISYPRSARIEQRAHLRRGRGGKPAALARWGLITPPVRGRGYRPGVLRRQSPPSRTCAGGDPRPAMATAINIHSQVLAAEVKAVRFSALQRIWQAGSIAGWRSLRPCPRKKEKIMSRRLTLPTHYDIHLAHQ